MADAQNKLPLLSIDFSKGVDYNVFYPLTDASMAKALGSNWTAEKVRIVNAQHGILSALPRRCMGKEGCPVSGECTFSEEVIAREFAGANCPIEVTEAFKLFAGYVIDLDIQPEDFTDIQMVMDLVRLTLLTRRCDYFNKTNDFFEEKTISVPGTRETYKSKVPNATLNAMTSMRNDTHKLYEKLIASREGKVKKESILKNSNSASDFFSQIKKAAENAHLGGKKKSGAQGNPQENSQVIDADYSEQPALESNLESDQMIDSESLGEEYNG